jgi:outer membrane lipoprotein LolB
LLALVLSGCAAFREDTPTGRDWQAHSAQLAALREWTASGKVALRSAEAAESATLLWRQQGPETDLQLQGPLGVGATAIRSDGRQLEINRDGERRVLDISTPDAIRASTGWDLPLQALVHWLKGLPSPDSTVQDIDLDPDTGLLEHLSQDGWEIHYMQYGEFGEFTLPRHLQIRRGMTEAKVVISHWKTVPG